MVLRLGTRGSRLALIQTEEVRRLLKQEATETIPITTKGDRITDRPLFEIGGKSLFLKEIEEALLRKEIDIAVHSLKDVPSILPDGLEIGCILPRADPREAWFSNGHYCLEDMPVSARVGTSSLRRQAQVLARRPDLEIVPIRGNVETRLIQLERGTVDATLLAFAGIQRLEVTRKPDTLFDPQVFLPAIGQGALGLEIRRSDDRVRDLIRRFACPKTTACVTLERTFLAALEGSCRMPIAGLATISDDSNVHFCGLVLSPDGQLSFTIERTGPMSEAYNIGYEAGQTLKAGLPKNFKLL